MYIECLLLNGNRRFYTLQFHIFKVHGYKKPGRYDPTPCCPLHDALSMKLHPLLLYITDLSRFVNQNLKIRGSGVTKKLHFPRYLAPHPDLSLSGRTQDAAVSCNLFLLIKSISQVTGSRPHISRFTGPVNPRGTRPRPAARTPARSPEPASTDRCRSPGSPSIRRCTVSRFPNGRRFALPARTH